MKEPYYNSFEEWKLDYERVSKNPRDTSFLQEVEIRVKNSKEEIVQEIKNYLLDNVLENNPWLVFGIISKENPNHILLVKNPNDPWFKV